jgi:hypothetical protein
MQNLSPINQILVTAIVVAGSIGVAAIAFQFSGFIEMQCSSAGCHVVIDGRSL